jgi:hypothetical protein
MEIQFRNMDRAIESQPMPPQFEDTKALVYCNDCYAKSPVKYHWLGLKCGVYVSFLLSSGDANVTQCRCSSYNTAQLQILSGPEPESLPAPDSEGLLRGVDVGELVVPSSPEHRPSVSSARDSTSATPAVETIPSISNSQPHLALPISEEIPSATSAAATAEEDDDDEEDEVDFWGGESPRERRISALRREDTIDEDDDDESTSDEGQDMDMDEDEDADDVEDDRMEIFGHR